MNDNVMASLTLITAVLEHIEAELDRVQWNINQEEYASPFRNTGNVEGFKTDVFEVHAYDWGWDYNESSPQKPNFKWRDFEVYWYKYLGRGMSTNMGITPNALDELLKECIESLLKYEEEHDGK